MATRLKTVQFAFDPITTTITDATVTNFVQRTINIPETVISFVSVTAEVSFQDLITATGGTITEHRVGLRLGAAAYTTFTETDDISNSGENLAGVIGPIDFTSHFTTNWTGTSMTCDMQVYFDQSTGTTQGMTNVTGIITVTYQYDDDPATNATQIKTAWIPLESLVGALSTTADSNIGSNQIPQLTGVGGMLPENSVTIRDYYFVMEGNQSLNNSNVDFTPSVNIDGGTAFTFATIEAALVSESFQRLVWRPSAVPDTTAAHNFQMWATATRMNHITITLVVTYEFNAAATTRILNSVYVPLEIASPIGVNTAAEASRFNRRLSIQEANPTLAQSAVRINFNASAAVSGINLRVGSQAFRGYTHVGNVICGMFSMQQRIDSGSAQGAGFTVAHGFNDINVDLYATDTTDQMTNINGSILLKD